VPFPWHNLWNTFTSYVLNKLVWTYYEPNGESVRLLPSVEVQGRITWPDQCTTGWHDSSKAVNVVAPLYSFTSCVYISTPGQNIHMSLHEPISFQHISLQLDNIVNKHAIPSIDQCSFYSWTYSWT